MEPMTSDSETQSIPVCLWRDQIAALLGQYPTAVSINDIETRIARPADVPTHVELPLLLQADPQQRFAVSGSGETARARRVYRADDEELQEYVEEWRTNLERYLSTQPVPISLSDLGSHIVRPSRLPAPVKLIDVLKCDPRKRFAITSEASGGKAHLNFELSEKQIASLIDQWRENVSRLICNSSTSTSAADISANVLRPHCLPEDITLYEILKSDPANRFAISGEPPAFRVRRVYRVDDETILPFVEVWRNAVANFLTTQYSTVSLSDIGSHISRPAQLPISVKLIDVIKSDPWQRFVLSGDGNNIRAALSTSARSYPPSNGTMRDNGSFNAVVDADVYRVPVRQSPYAVGGPVARSQMMAPLGSRIDVLPGNNFQVPNPYVVGRVAGKTPGTQSPFGANFPPSPSRMAANVFPEPVGHISGWPYPQAMNSDNLSLHTEVFKEPAGYRAGYAPSAQQPNFPNPAALVPAPVVYNRDGSVASAHSWPRVSKRAPIPPRASSSPSGQYDQQAHPKSYVCPLTGKLMVDPVVCGDGCSYERAAIEDWLVYSRYSPVTGFELSSATVRPDNHLKVAIANYTQAKSQKPQIRSNFFDLATPTSVADGLGSKGSQSHFWGSTSASSEQALVDCLHTELDGLTSLQDVAAQLGHLSMKSRLPELRGLSFDGELMPKSHEAPLSSVNDWRPLSSLLTNVVPVPSTAGVPSPPKSCSPSGSIKSVSPPLGHTMMPPPPGLFQEQAAVLPIAAPPSLRQNGFSKGPRDLSLAQELSQDLTSWLSTVFVGFDRELVTFFANKLQADVGFITVSDLLEARDRSQLTFDLLQQVAGFKIGHFNRLLTALNRYNTI